MTTNRTKLSIAHRGLWNEDIPENSIPAFQKCLDSSIPIELDVHLLKDHTLVVFHDDNLKRMTGIDKEIKDCTYDEIKNVRLKDTDCTIPRFEDVLKLVDGKVLLDIEIKYHSSLEVCKSLATQLDDYNGEFFVKSFSPLHIAWFRFKRPKYKRGLLVSRLKNARIPKFLKCLLFDMKFNFLCKPDFIAFDHDELPNKKIEKLKKKGVPIYLWTIRNEDVTGDYDGIIYELRDDKKRP